MNFKRYFTVGKSGYATDKFYVGRKYFKRAERSLTDLLS